METHTINEINSKRFTSEEKNILINMTFGHFLSHFNMLVFPPLVIPLTIYLKMDIKNVLSLSFYMYLLFGLSALPWGVVGDRLGAKKLMFLFFIGSGVCAILAGNFIDHPFLFSLFLGGVGFFSGIYHPIGLGIISKGISRMSFALGINGMFGNLGLATAPLVAGIVNFFFGIKMVFIFLGGINFLGALLLGILNFNEPISIHLRNDNNPSNNTNSLLYPFIILCICMMLGGIVYRGNTVILPAYFELKNQHFLELLKNLNFSFLTSNVSATLTTSFVFMLGMTGQFIGGMFAERYDPRYGYLLFHSMTIFLALIIAHVANIPLIVTSVLYFFFLLGMQPMENTLVARLTPTKMRHSGYGTKFILTFGVGSISVYAVGFIKKIFGISSVYYFFSACSFVLVLTILYLIKITQQSRKI